MFRMNTMAVPPGPAEGYDLGGSEESLARLREYFAVYGDTYRVFAPARGVYNWVINHPDDVKRVLLSNHRNYTKGEGMDRVKILLGNGIMTSEGDFWRRQRRMIQPAFHRRILDRFGRTDCTRQRQICGALGREERARRTDRRLRRNQRADSRNRAEFDFRHRSSAPRAAIRRESLRGRRQGVEPRPQIRVSFSLAGAPRRRTHRTRRREARSISIS
jgi:hypothetical protein